MCIYILTTTISTPMFGLPRACKAGKYNFYHKKLFEIQINL